jgi:predicted nuclease of predicted toxin-antitoxin system
VKVLLDEDLPTRLRLHFPEGVVVETVEYRGWKGLENSALLRVAEAEFDVLATADDNLPEQQNLTQFDLAIVVLRARSKRFNDLLVLMPEVQRRLSEAKPGQALRIHPRGGESG